MNHIPLFDLNYDERETEAVTAVLKSKWISSGPKCLELEKKFQAMFDVSCAYAVSNCTAALHLALVSLGIGAGDEVILPSMTFVATANAVKYAGAVPVFCDVTSEEDITIDPVKIEELISDRTRCIIVMHYAGFACDMNPIMALAKKYNLYVVEDACHGPLSEYYGKKLGTIGDVGCFSFFSNKNISTGEGGMIVTRHKDIGDKIKLLRSHGMTTMSYERDKGHATMYDVVELGYNYRLEDIRASIAVVQMEKLQGDLEKRKEIRDLYLEQLRDCPGLILPFCNHQEFASNYIMPVVLKNSNYTERDKIRQYLNEKGIQTSIHYPAVHRFSIYNDAKKGRLVNTEYIADCEVSLPMYSKLTKKEIIYICKTLKDALKGV